MSLTAIMNAAITGLSASQAAVGVTSQNVANANTAGYSRHVVQFEQQVAGTVGVGVKISDIDRVVDQFLTREVRSSAADVGDLTERKRLFEQMTALFGAPGDNSSIANDLSSFSAAIEALAVNPEDGALRYDVVATGEQVARTLRTLARGVQDLRQEADRSIDAAANDVNAQLKVVYDLNKRIAQANAAGDAAPDLQDKRDQALLAISSQMGIATLVRENGEVHVFTDQGQSLVDAKLRQLVYDPAATMAAGATFTPIRIVPVDGDTLAPQGDGEVLVSGGTSATVSGQLATGGIAGLLVMRDRELRNIGDQIEALATRLRDTINGIHNQGTSVPAPQTLTGTRDVAATDAFSGTGTVRIAIVDRDGAVVGTPLDLDLGALGVTTVGGLLTAINAALGTDGSASLVNGKLVLQATDGANGIAINELTSAVTGTGRGFSHHFGFNDFFVGIDAQTLTVNAALQSDPSRVATAQLSATAITGAVAISVGDNTIVNRLAAAFETATSFSAVGGLPATDYTFGAFASSIIGLASTKASALEDELSHTQSVLDNVVLRQGTVAGVNVDEEMSNLVLFQTAYQASARVLTTAIEMFDTLVEMMR